MYYMILLKFKVYKLSNWKKKLEYNNQNKQVIHTQDVWEEDLLKVYNVTSNVK